MAQTGGLARFRKEVSSVIHRATHAHEYSTEEAKSEVLVANNEEQSGRGTEGSRRRRHEGSKRVYQWASERHGAEAEVEQRGQDEHVWIERE